MAEEAREKWGNKLDFILACLGYAVGLGNVWRFPYLCGRNGGAAFMVPYLTMMILAGFPIFYMELAIGQYAALTPLLLYRRMCPIFAGIGYSMVMICAFTIIYYNMIIAWALYYFAASFTTGSLPWNDCTNEWNAPRHGKICWDDKIVNQCSSPSNITDCLNITDCSNVSSYHLVDLCQNITMYVNGSCHPLIDLTNATGIYCSTYGIERSHQSPSLQYNDYVLSISDGIEHYGYPKGTLVACLAVAWLLCFLCMCKGVKSSGKVVYFTATFPYVILIVLFVRGLMLDGAEDGIEFYLLKPDFSKLKEARIWGDAAIQILFSMSVGGGGLTTLASYNDFNNNLLRDTLIVVLGNCCTSFFAGFVIFPIVGFVAKQLYPNLPVLERVGKLAAGGPTLAFVAYPDALTRLPAAPVWAILFFFMLVLLGIDSQIVMVEVVITAICDQWPKLRAWRYKVATVAAICVVCFIIGLSLTCPGGPYLLNMVDTFAGGWPLLVTCLTEVIMVGWLYGFRRFIGDIQMMLGKPPNKCWKYLGYPVNPYWWICWIGFTPALLAAILVFNWVEFEKLKYSEYVYPDWAQAMGWGIALLCVLWIPVMAIFMYCKAYKSHWGKVPSCYRWLIEPTLDWGPADMAKKTSGSPNEGHQIPLESLSGQLNPAFKQELYRKIMDT